MKIQKQAREWEKEPSLACAAQFSLGQSLGVNSM